MHKKLTFLGSFALGIIMFASSIALPVNAQLFPYTGTSPTASLPSSSTGTPASPTATATAGFIQFDNLTVTNVAGTDAAGTIAAASGGATSCAQFADANGTAGIPTTCPVPSGTTGTSTYTLTVDVNTQFLLSDRSNAVLENFAAGDVINVFGSANGGTIQAMVIRDLSKPAVGGLGPPVAPPPTPTPVVGSNPTVPQLVSILQELLFQMQGVLTQIIQLSGGTSAGTSLAPMIPAPSSTTSSAPY